MPKLISIVIPAYNEELVLDELKRRLQEVMNKLNKYEFEVIIIEHGSLDNTYNKLLEIHREDDRFKIVQLSRNFGCDGGVDPGLKYAKGDAAVIMSADLQDPPELIPEFIKKWEQGYEIVYGIIKRREGVSLARKVISPVFYSVIHFLTKGQVPKNVADFQLIDKKVYAVINKMPEHHRFIRGMISWLGFKSIGIEFVKSPRYREGGEAKVTGKFQVVRKMVGFIINAIFTFSDFPLKLITWVGILASLFSFFLAMYFLSTYFLFGAVGRLYIRGYTPWMLVILFLFGILFIFLGVIGLYISRIYEEVRQRPLYIVTKKIGLE